MYDVYEKVKPGLGETVLPALKGSKQVAAGRAKDFKKINKKTFKNGQSGDWPGLLKL